MFPDRAGLRGRALLGWTQAEPCQVLRRGHFGQLEVRLFEWTRVCLGVPHNSSAADHEDFRSQMLNHRQDVRRKEHYYSTTCARGEKIADIFGRDGIDSFKRLVEK